MLKDRLVTKVRKRSINTTIIVECRKELYLKYLLTMEFPVEMDKSDASSEVEK